MIDKDLIIDKEEYIKKEFILSLTEKLSYISKSGIDNTILEIKQIIEEFELLNNESFNINNTILNKESINDLVASIKNTKTYNLENTSFNILKDYIRNSLITIGAESSVGKTSFATQLGLEILENNNDTLLSIYSLDDSKIFLMKKMIIQILTKKYKKKYDDKNLIEIMTKNNSQLNLFTSGRISINDKLNIYNLYSQLLQFQKYANNNLNIKNPRIIVIIDYLQIIDHDNSNLREGLNKICSTIKEIQKKLDCLILLISQFNRPKDRDSTVNTLTRYRETSEIENISDICMNLEAIRDDKYNTKLYIVKNKAGEKDKEFFSTRNIYSFSKFTDYKKYKIQPSNKEENKYDEKYEIRSNIEDFIF